MVCTRVTVVQSSRRTLIPIVRPAISRSRSSAASRSACSARIRSSRLEVGEVVVEGGLDRARLELAPGDARVAAEVRALVKAAAVAARRSGARGRRAGGAAARRSSHAERVEALGGLRADPRHQARRLGANRCGRLLAGEDDEAGGLLGVGGDLGDELVRPDPDRGVEAELARGSRRTSPLIRATGSGTPTRVEIDLVERGRLGRHAELADQLHHLARALAVVGHVDRQLDQAAGSSAPRVGDRHRRADPELAAPHRKRW